MLKWLIVSPRRRSKMPAHKSVKQSEKVHRNSELPLNKHKSSEKEMKPGITLRPNERIDI